MNGLPEITEVKRLTVRPGDADIEVIEQAPARTFCEHRLADHDSRGRNCAECGLLMLYFPGVAWPA